MATVRQKKAIVKKNQNFIPIAYDETALDPRRELFKAWYTDPTSPVFGNALQSALRSGFSKDYARNIITIGSQWIREIVGRKEITDLAINARENLKEFLTMNVNEQVIGMNGPVYDKDEEGKRTIPVFADNVKKMEIKSKVSMFVAEKIDSDFRKKEMEDDGKPLKVEFKQIIIIAPNGKSVPYNKADAQAISSLSETS